MLYLVGSLFVVGIILVSVGWSKDSSASFDDGSFMIEVATIGTGIVFIVVAAIIGVMWFLMPHPISLL